MVLKIFTLIGVSGQVDARQEVHYYGLATIVQKANKSLIGEATLHLLVLHFSEIHSTLLVNFHLQRHMGNFVIQVMNRRTNSHRTVDWEYASEIIDDEVD